MKTAGFWHFLILLKKLLQGLQSLMMKDQQQQLHTYMYVQCVYIVLCSHHLMFVVLGCMLAGDENTDFTCN